MRPNCSFSQVKETTGRAQRRELFPRTARRPPPPRTTASLMLAGAGLPREVTLRGSSHMPSPVPPLPTSTHSSGSFLKGWGPHRGLSLLNSGSRAFILGKLPSECGTWTIQMTNTSLWLFCEQGSRGCQRVLRALPRYQVCLPLGMWGRARDKQQVIQKAN